MNTEPTELSIRERIFKICNDLHSQNHKPKIRTILDLLPDVKSTSTVHKYFGQWKEELEAKKKQLFETFGFSQQFQSAFVAEIARVHSEAKNEFAEKLIDLEEERNAALQGLKDAELSLADKNALNTSLQEQVAELEKEAVLLASEAKKQSELQDKEKLFAIEKLQQKFDDTVESLSQQIESLTSTNNELRQTCETQRTELAKTELKLESNSELVKDVKQRIIDVEEQSSIKVANLTDDLSALSKNHSKSLQDLAVVNEKLAAKTELLELNSAQYISARESEQALKALITQREQENSELNATIKRITIELDNSKVDVLNLTEKLGEYKHVIARLEVNAGE